MKWLYSIYLRGIRRLTSPLFYWIVRYLTKPDLSECIWSGAANLTAEEFSDLVNQYDYNLTAFWQLLDFSPQEPEFFFFERSFSRDCRDWSRMWLWWAQEQGYRVWEVVVVDGYRFWGGGHYFTVYQDDDGAYVLCNYRVVGKYPTYEEAIDQFRTRELTRYGRYENPIYVVVREGKADGWDRSRSD